MVNSVPCDPNQLSGGDADRCAVHFGRCASFFSYQDINNGHNDDSWWMPAQFLHFTGVTPPPAVHLAMQNSSFALHVVRLAQQCNFVLYVHFGAPCSTLVAVVWFTGDSGPEMPRTFEV